MKSSTLPEIKGLSIIAGFGIVWNFLGVSAFIIALITSRVALESAGTPDFQIDYIFATPLWAKIANGVAVFAGFVGSMALLLRRQLAYYMFVLSLFAVMLVMLDTMFRNGFTYLGPVNNAFSLAIVLIGLFLFWIGHRTNMSGNLS